MFCIDNLTVILIIAIVSILVRLNYDTTTSTTNTSVLNTKYEPTTVLHPLIDDQKRLNYEILMRQPKNSYSKIGILTNANSDPTNILSVYGRKTYPGSSRYDYYVAIENNRHDMTKIPLISKKELYDGDTIEIPELNKVYTFNDYRNKYREMYGNYIDYTY